MRRRSASMPILLAVCVGATTSTHLPETPSPHQNTYTTVYMIPGRRSTPNARPARLLGALLVVKRGAPDASDVLEGPVLHPGGFIVEVA